MDNFGVAVVAGREIKIRESFFSKHDLLFAIDLKVRFIIKIVYVKSLTI